jgi:hypothetical protein
VGISGFIPACGVDREVVRCAPNAGNSHWGFGILLAQEDYGGSADEGEREKNAASTINIMITLKLSSNGLSFGARST